MSDSPLPPLVRLVGPSGCGKTTLGEGLVRVLGARGYRVSVVKSAQHHRSPPDRTGSDTVRYRSAGAVAVAGLFVDGVVVRLPRLEIDQLLALLSPVSDLVLVEGARQSSFPALVFGDEQGDGPVVARITAHPRARRTPPEYHSDDLERIGDAVERLSDVRPLPPAPGAVSWMLR